MNQIDTLAREAKQLIDCDEYQRRSTVQKRLSQLETVHPVPFNSWNLTAGFPIVVISWCKRLDRPLDLEVIAKETGVIDEKLARQLIEFQLLQKIEKFNNVPDDTPISNAIHTNLGLCWMYQKGPMGEEYAIDESTGAFVSEPFIKTEDDIDRLQMPHFDFDRSLHEFRIRVFEDIAGDGIVVIDDALPRNIGAPFSTANNLAGVLEILEAFITRPAFVHRLMSFVADAIVSYTGEISEAMGGTRIGTFGCDEVSCDMFSPASYEEFVWPYECRAAAAYDSIYYHSCGNLTPLFERILEIPNIHRVHVSPWSDMSRAVEVLNGKVVMEKHLAPTVNLNELTPDEMRAFVKEVTDFGTDYPLDMVVATNTPGGRLYRSMFYEEAESLYAGSR